MLRKAATGLAVAPGRRALATFAPARLFDYDTITANIHVRDAIDSVELAFGKLAEGKVDVPFPMHIGVGACGPLVSPLR